MKKRGLIKIISIIVVVLVVIIIAAFFIFKGGERSLRNDYLLQMKDLGEETGEVIKEYSLTSKKLSNHTITSSQAIENYKTYKEQFQNIRNEMGSLSPTEDFEEAHQHYLDALDLLIEACDLVIKGAEETSISDLYKAIDKLNKATTEIETFTELVKQAS
jgi:uncharacterized protein YxeA